MKHRFFTLLLAMMASVGTMRAIVYSGSCGAEGDNLLWSLDIDNEVLTITGTGTMADFESMSSPWNEYSSSVKSVIISDGVTNIGNNAFAHCLGLKTINIPYGVTKIGEGAFNGCNYLPSIIFPNTINDIGVNAFTNCRSLTSIEIPNSVKRIRTYAFYKCTGITNLVIPESVTRIDGWAFCQCSSLTSVTLPASVTTLGDNVFYNCTSLTSFVNYSTEPQTINLNFFAEVNLSAATLYVPAESVEAYKAANGWKEFGNILPIEETKDYLTIAEAIEIGMAMDSMATSEQKYTIEGYVINAGSFNSQYKIQSWYMVDDLNATSSVFQAYSCYPIYGEDTVAVTGGSKVRMTGKLQKYYNKLTASYLVEMTRVPATILSLREIDTITVAEALAIGNELEEGAYTPLQYTIRGYVSSVHIPFDEQLGNQSFYIADDISSTANSKETGGFYIYCGKPVTGEAVKVGAFVEITAAIYNYRGMYIENYEQNIPVTILKEAPESVAISGSCGENLTWELSCDSVLTISGTDAMWSLTEEQAWRPYKERIKTAILPEGLDSLAPKAFYQCVNLTSVNLPNSVRAIGRKAFVECDKLTEPVYNEHIFAFLPAEYSSTYSVPEGIVSIAAYAISFIPPTAESTAIASLKEIVLPSSLKRLGISSLAGAHLNKITCYATTPPVCDQSVFDYYFDEIGVVIHNIDRSIPVYVPAESVEAYKAADQWKDFNIQAIPADSIEADFDVVYVDPSNNELQREPITLHLPVAPTIEGFTFLKWQVAAGDLENAIFIQAVYTANEPNSVPEVYTNPANSAQKLIRNGNIYILTGDKTYTITGQKVK